MVVILGQYRQELDRNLTVNEYLYP